MCFDKSAFLDFISPLTFSILIILYCRNIYTLVKIEAGRRILKKPWKNREEEENQNKREDMLTQNTKCI
jgi:hypothetical protein